MSDNTPHSGSAGPHKGFRKGLGAILSSADTSATFKNITKAGQKAGHSLKNLFPHKEAPTEAVNGIRELGADGFDKYNLDDDNMVFISRRSKDVFEEDEFIRATAGRYVGPADLGIVEEKEDVAEVKPSQASSFYPSFDTAPAPKKFGGAAEPPKAEAPKIGTVKSSTPSYLNNLARSSDVKRPAKRIEWDDEVDKADDEGLIIKKVDDGVDATDIPEAPAVAVPEPVAAVEDVAEDIVAAVLEIPSITVEEIHAKDAPVIESPVMESVTESPIEEPVEDIRMDDVAEEPVAAPEVPEAEEPVEEVPEEIPVESPMEEIVEEVAVEEPVIVATPKMPSVDTSVVAGLHTEGDSESSESISTLEKAIDAPGATAETSAGVVMEPVQPVPPATDLSGYGIKGLSDPVVSRPRPKYRSYKFDGGRLCDSGITQGKSEAPQRPLD